MWDEWYSQIVISGSDDSETYAIECDTSLFDDEIMVFAIKIYTDEVRIIIVANYISNSTNRIYMSRDEVSIDASLRTDTALYIEYIPNFFWSKISTRKTLLHRKECIILRCDGCQSHTDSIVRDTLSDGEWLIVEVIPHNKSSTLSGDDTRCTFDNSGKQVNNR